MNSVSATIPRARTHSGLPPLVLTDGAVEALKWLALALMVLDHTNKFLYAGKLVGAYEAGRLVMPLFGFIFAYNLARSSAAVGRTSQRLFWFGLAAAPMFYVLVGIWPLNILFTLLVSAGVIALVQRGGRLNMLAASALFLLGGAVVEFWWPAVALVVASWLYCRRPRISAALCMLGALVVLNLVNKNWWAFAAVPMLLLASAFPLQVSLPRMKWLFYFFYPVHLAVILLVQRFGWLV